MKKIILIIALLTLTVGIEAEELSSDVDLYKTQVSLLKAEITLAQCTSIREGLKLDSKSCELISSQYDSFARRARKLVESVPSAFKDKVDEYYIAKISDLIKAFPDTTDKEVLDAMINRNGSKKTQEQVI